jgi:hypothetical protein
MIMPTGIANAEEYEVTFVLPDTCVMGTDLIIKGTSTGGDTLDITIDDIMAAVDIPIDENGRFTKKIPSGAESMFFFLGGYVIKAYVNGPKDRDGNRVEVKVGEIIPEGLGIFDEGDTLVIMTVPTLSAKQSTNFVVQGGTYSITGTAPGSDYVDLVIVSSKGSYGVGIDGGQGITVYYVPVSKTDYTFSKTITLDKNAEDGGYIAMVLSPGMDQVYGMSEKWTSIADFITSGIFDLKTQPEALDLLTSKTIYKPGSDDLSQSFSFIVGKETGEFVPPKTSVDAEQSTNIVAVGDSYRISGTCYGSNFVNIVIISPKGGEGNAIDGTKPGIKKYALFMKNHRFSKRIPVDKNVTRGYYEVLVLSPGRNGIYDGIGTGDLIKGVSNKYGGYEYLASYKTQNELVAIIRDATIEAAGSDDIAQELRLKIESPYIYLEDIEDVLIGDTLKINGTTNREKGTKIMISSQYYGPVDLPMAIGEVEWPTPDEGVFTATIDTHEAVVGTYEINADDREGCRDFVDVNIVATLPTPTPTPTATLTLPNMSIDIGTFGIGGIGGIGGRLYNLWNHTQIATPMPSPTPTSSNVIIIEEPAQIATPTPNQTSTPHLWIERITYSIWESIVFLKKDIKWAISVIIAFLILVVGLANIYIQFRKKKKVHHGLLLKETLINFYTKLKEKIKEFVFYVKRYMISLRILSWIMLIVSILAVIYYIFSFFEYHYVYLGLFITPVGITASILIFKKKRIGVILALIWSAFQFLSVQIDSLYYNFIQFLDLSLYFSIGGVSFGINIFAIVLFYLFFIKRKELDI